MTVHSSAGGETEDTIIDSTATAVDAATESTGQDAQTPQSSSGEDATEATLLDVIRNAAAPETSSNGPESSNGKSGQETATSDATQTEQTASAANDESEVPFHKHPRWQAMLRERDSLKGDAEQYQQIQSYMAANQLDSTEVATGFEIMALMRRDPEAALAKLLPYVASLELVTGRKLPEDLSQRVEDGVVDEETARETARLRMEAQRYEAARVQAEQAAQQTAQVTTAESMRAAVRVLESELTASDPDYGRKQPFVMDRVRALIAEQRPATPDEAVAIVRRAHTEISDQLKPVMQRKPVKTMTSGDAQTSSRPAPSSLLDVVRIAAQSSR
jgi:hypothetical protein